jgi:hypothetical protein
MSRIALIYLRKGGMQHIVEKLSKGIQFFLRLHLNPKFAQRAMASKFAKVLISRISRLPT